MSRVPAFLLSALALAQMVACASDAEMEPSFLLDVLMSTEIPTVASVSWQGRTGDLLEAYVEFGREGEQGSMIPAGVEDFGELEAIVVGMKPESEYWLQGRLVYDGRETVSDIEWVTTGAQPTQLCGLTLDTSDEALESPGYLVTANMPGIPEIIDVDGERVWWRDGGHADEGIITRVRLSHDRSSVVYLTWDSFAHAGPVDDIRKITRVSLDGTEVSEVVLPMAHHDFVELPDGTLATLQFALLPTDEGEVYGDRIVEIDVDGIETEVWSTWDARDFQWEDVHEGATRWGHANAIDYDPVRGVYQVSVLYFDTIFEIDRATGETRRRIGGEQSDYVMNESDDRWFDGQHQFEVLDGGVLVFDNGPPGLTETRVAEYSLDDDSWTAQVVWQHTHDPPLGIYAFGDTSRIGDVNTLVSWSSAGRVQQVAPDGTTVWSVSADLGAGFGYADWVSSLYD